MEIFKKILNFVLVFCAIVGCIFDVVYIYNIVNDKGLFTFSTATYATSVVDPLTGEELSPFTVTYYEDYNNIGKEVVEFRVNCYSDINKTAIYKRGYQLIINNDGSTELYYCDSFGDMSWGSMNKYDETNDDGQNKNFWYIDINGDIYAVRLDGSYEYVSDVTYSLGQFASTFFGSLFGVEDWIDYTVHYSTHYYTMSELMLEFKKLLKSCSYGTGEYTMPLVDLGNFLHIYEVKDGIVSDTPIGNGGLINSYFAIDCKYERRGITYADQSMFGSVAGDSNFNVTGIDFDANYWQVTQEYVLTEEDFIDGERYSNVDNGYYYALTAEKINELKNYKDIEIIINFDCSKLENKNVLGFDYYALNGLKISELNISNSVNKEFILQVGSIKDTGIEVINLHNVTINNLSGTEVEYEVV